MLKKQEVEEFVEFGVKSNVMLVELKEYLDKGYGTQRKWLRNYAKNGMATLGRMYRLLSLLGQKNTDRYTFYDIETDGNKPLFPGFVVKDFADPRAPLIRINNYFVQSITSLFNYILAANKEIVMLTGFTIDMPDIRNKQYQSHSNGRAIDIFIKDMPPNVSFMFIADIVSKHPELSLLIIEYPKWVHIERRGNKSYILPIGEKHFAKSCNPLMKLDDI